jgi:hypothetical protein
MRIRLKRQKEMKDKYRSKMMKTNDNNSVLENAEYDETFSDSDTIYDEPMIEPIILPSI